MRSPLILPCQQNVIINTFCTALRFIPGHENLLLASYADGSLFIFDIALDQGREFIVPRDTASGMHFLVNKDKTVNPVCTWKRMPAVGADMMAGLMATHCLA